MPRKKEVKKEVKKVKKETSLSVSINSEIYPLEAIYGACYAFLDKAYISLEGDPKKEVKVNLKLKSGSPFLVDKLKDEFLNELLNYSLRYEISERNKKIREYIVGASLLGASGEFLKKLEGNDDDCGCEDKDYDPTCPVCNPNYDPDCPDCNPDSEYDPNCPDCNPNCGCEDKEDEIIDDGSLSIEWKDDPLGIAVPWEEKYIEKDKDSEKTEKEEKK